MVAKLRKQNFANEAARFLISGFLNTALTYWIYCIFVDLLGYSLAFSIAFIIGIIFAYYLNCIFVFKARIKVKSLYQYPAIYSLYYFFGLCVLTILIDYLGVNDKLAPIINMLFLIPVSFLVNKWFFRGVKMSKWSVDQCQLIDLPKITDPRGNLTFIENSNQIPFDIKRVYYLYDIPGGSDRGAHAHKNLHQFVVAMSGSFDIELDDGVYKRRFHLNRSYYGLYVCPMMWRFLDNFSSGAVCMVLASEPYHEEDYIRSYDEFISFKGLSL